MCGKIELSETTRFRVSTSVLGTFLRRFMNCHRFMNCPTPIILQFCSYAEKLYIYGIYGTKNINETMRYGYEINLLPNEELKLINQIG